jgi:hypothetical protein
MDTIEKGYVLRFKCSVSLLLVVTGWRRRCCGRRRQGARGEWRRRRPQHRTQCFQSRRRLVRNVPIVLKFRFCFDCFVQLSRAWLGKHSFVFVKTSTHPLGWVVIAGLRRQHGFCLQLVELAEALVAAEPTSRRGAVRFLVRSLLTPTGSCSTRQSTI